MNKFFKKREITVLHYESPFITIGLCKRLHCLKNIVYQKIK